MKTIITIDNDAHTIANLISSELIFLNKDASYRVPHPNSVKSQIILHENCTTTDLKIHVNLYCLCYQILNMNYSISSSKM